MVEDWRLVEEEGPGEVEVAVPDVPAVGKEDEADLPMADVTGQVEIAEPGESDVVMDLPLPPLPQEVEVSTGTVATTDTGAVGRRTRRTCRWRT